MDIRQNAHTNISNHFLAQFPGPNVIIVNWHVTKNWNQILKIVVNYNESQNETFGIKNFVNLENCIQ